MEAMSHFIMNKPLWEGKKELVWILAFLFLFIVAYSYHTETKTCREIKESVCWDAWNDCMFWKTIDAFKKENPGVQMSCNATTRTCEMAGVVKTFLLPDDYDYDMINFSYQP